MTAHDCKWGDPVELAALYAAGALTDSECTAFEAHLDAGCPACSAEVAPFAAVAAKLLLPVPEAVPPPGVRAALLDRLAAASSPLRGSVLEEAMAREPGLEVIVRKPVDGPWQDTAVPGVRLRVLSVDRTRNQFSALVRMAPGAAYPRHVHAGPEECMVLEGELHVGDAVMHAGDYQHAPVGSTHGVQRTETGCLLFITSSLSDEFA